MRINFRESTFTFSNQTSEWCDYSNGILATSGWRPFRIRYFNNKTFISTSIFFLVSCHVVPHTPLDFFISVIQESLTIFMARLHIESVLHINILKMAFNISGSLNVY